MHSELFRIGPFALHSYGLMVFLGFAFGIWLSARRADNRGFSREIVYDASLWILISSLLGARFLYIVTHLDDFRGRWLDTISPIQSDGTIGIAGLVLLGGVIFAIAALILYSRLKKIPLFTLTDILVPGLAVGEFFGRIGCFLNGCCFGLPSHLPWAVVFPSTCPAGAQFPDTPVQPTQLYMSLAALLTVFVLLYAERWLKKPGQLFGLYLTIYGPVRILIESIRWYESSMKPFSDLGSAVTVSQMLSVGIFLGGLYLLRRKQPVTKKRKK
ncbi:MAG: prolipoprotein diacylglyceryl transferase [bacterium]|nr:prolipoprotein diacylglyceryl transferase [bacterium]